MDATGWATCWPSPTAPTTMKPLHGTRPPRSTPRDAVVAGSLDTHLFADECPGWPRVREEVEHGEEGFDAQRTQTAPGAIGDRATCPDDQTAPRLEPRRCCWPGGAQQGLPVHAPGRPAWV